MDRSTRLASGLLVIIIVVSITKAQQSSQTPNPDPCPVGHNESLATVSSIYTANTEEEAGLLPNLLTDPPGCPKIVIPWWHSHSRLHALSETVRLLLHRLQQDRTMAVDKAPGYVTGHKRKRRQVVNTFFQECFAKNSFTAIGTRRLCGECSVVTVLAPNRSPQYINEQICDVNQAGQTCFSGEGTCMQQSIVITIQKELGNGLFQSENYNLRTGCRCELFNGSVLVSLNP